MFDLARKSQRSLERLLPRITPLIPDADEREIFVTRLETHFPTVFRLLHHLYGDQYDFFYHLEQTLRTAAESYTARPTDLKTLDRQREAAPAWFHSEGMVGGVCYADLFAGDLDSVREKIPYFKELGLTYLHLMPPFKTPAGNNDGGYAISSYREVDPPLGSTDDLVALAAELRANGISLVLDFVFNHTSDEHIWAKRAQAGDPEYEDYYRLFDDDRLPRQYEQHLREIFPEQAPGNFLFRPDMNKWVWTTFHHFQWDLNYANPAVFTAMLGEMLFMANLGTEVLRLDAVAFIWKRLGTNCEGLSEVHMIIQAFNALVQVAAPAMLFKSEAIVHPAEVLSYISPDEAPVSYNPTLMALLWDSLATRDVTLLRHSMQRRFELPAGCTWVNYVRCHDDIGWTFADEDAWQLGVNGFAHRQFLNSFYTGRFPGSFAKGLPFNYNPVTQDMRISGMCASLAGLEQALERDNPLYIEHALRRIELIHAIIMSAGGIPLIYLGDEIAMLNDTSFADDPAKAHDSRWVHRLPFDWGRAAQRHDPDTIPGRVFQTVQHLITVRKQTPELRNGETQFFDTGSAHVFAFLRNKRVLVVANFSEHQQTVHLPWTPPGAVDLLTGGTYAGATTLRLEPYHYLWLASGEAQANPHGGQTRSSTIPR
jgi:amylosucrase